MGIIRFLEFLGSVGIFIYGLKIMSEGLQKIAGQGLRNLLSIIAHNRFVGVISGFFITGLIQSSSAITVMIVSFVNLGALSLVESAGVIVGANIGTTLTSWLVAYLGFKLEIIVFVLPTVGLAIPLLFSGVRKWKSVGEFLIGFSLLFFGLELMKDNFPDFSNHQEIIEIIRSFSDYGVGSLLLFILLGAFLTVIIQSSSAAMTITIVMAAQEYISFDIAVGFVLGANIGTTITAFLASMVGNEDARRASIIHVLFNVVGVILVLAIYPWFISWVDAITKTLTPEHYSIFSSSSSHKHGAMPLAVAVFHTLFNLMTAVVFLLGTKYVIQLSQLIIPTRTTETDNTEIILGKNLIDTPEIAVLEGKNALTRLSEESKIIFSSAKNFLFDEYEDKSKIYLEIDYSLQELRMRGFEVTKFLKEVAQSNTSEGSSNEIVTMLRIINEFEKIEGVIGDTLEAIKTKHDNRLEFKRNMSNGLEELSLLIERSFDVMKLNLNKQREQISIQEFNLIESEINDLRDSLRIRHLRRIGKKKDLIEEGLVFREIYSAFEKVGDHVYNINEALVNTK
ncbi:MAG: Na/Pi cotransporter family protein [Cytophagales bacterium]|nr:Na/Pi cotransporter family protein [Cytophagales bacterium]